MILFMQALPHNRCLQHWAQYSLFLTWSLPGSFCMRGYACMLDAVSTYAVCPPMCCNRWMLACRQIEE